MVAVTVRPMVDARIAGPPLMTLPCVQAMVDPRGSRGIGGHTSCLARRLGGSTEAPTLVAWDTGRDAADRADRRRPPVVSVTRSRAARVRGILGSGRGRGRRSRDCRG